VRDKAVLEDRLVKITTAPNDASIEIAGKRVGNGSYELKVPKNACVEVRVNKDGYIRYVKNYCNQANMQEPPVADFLEMQVDEAYTSSVSSDLANVIVSGVKNSVRDLPFLVLGTMSFPPGISRSCHDLCSNSLLRAP
jgi:hypothetical protein